MNKYLVTTVIILGLIVLGQDWALHNLQQLNQIQNETLVDYWNELQKCKR